MREMALPYRRERIADEITAERPIAFAYRSGDAAVRGSVSRQIVVVHGIRRVGIRFCQVWIDAGQTKKADKERSEPVELAP